MDKDARVEETVDLRTNVELVRSVSDKHHDLLRPSARNLSRGQSTDAAGHGKGKYALIRDPEVFQTGVYDKPLPFFGCGIGWFSFLFGFLCPPMWFYATILYFGNHYRKDPRERAGLGASAIAALVCSVASLMIGVILVLRYLYV
ncbi:hypothetical protein AAZX31_13G090100 [Glycine max]|uniref:Ribosomal protein L18ae family n=2 Tax=Glycine subgen. Soja TaxID=1462606 RepID=C6SXW3_SOYBN|nr:uncharacterized protein LOC100306083 [Glycine max]XP_014620629.1 uncharacterized protein LOC100306083 isoform X1 [Glycine max]XP_028196939.1 uncharacterized protein LOC114381913 [Glycine soja]XP_028196940.1 uncharacterized protein LOC114381913 [Glycine soja]ACU14086.1 unknown [Glycine max]KAG4959192.1 hypothetical protein JHK87_035825 [Glycine soja]KAG5112629.1 hypothetical protein JHK82_035898 [Glycine max]KAG5129906.1 hypothetical protein JHK84_036303 [Glycine max]KAH1100829.1 hypothet|eukprot:NP_001237263.1 uncharacterized protein LOC100306083 [Glycine max]